MMINFNIDNDLKITEKDLFTIMVKLIHTVSLIKNKTGQLKVDGTLITETDKIIDNKIKEFLLSLNSNIPIISEEGKFNEKEFEQDLYWLIDPIDGTENYSKGGKSYTINIALIKNGKPFLGIIGHPPSKSIWYGCNNVAYKKIKNEKYILKTKTNTEKPKIITSYNLDNETNNFIKKIKAFKLKKFSSSIKFCKIAEGEADIYPRLHSIKKWDIAAGDAIVRAAGGMLLDNKKEKYNYKSPTSDTGIFFAVSSKKEWARILQNII